MPRSANRVSRTVSGPFGLSSIFPLSESACSAPMTSAPGNRALTSWAFARASSSATSPGSISPLSLQSASWIAASSTSGSTIRNAIPAAVSSFRRLSVSDASTTSRWLKPSMRLAAFSTIIESSHVLLFDAKCVATPRASAAATGCCRSLSGSARTVEETVAGAALAGTPAALHSDSRSSSLCL